MQILKMTGEKEEAEMMTLTQSLTREREERNPLVKIHHLIEVEEGKNALPVRRIQMIAQIVKEGGERRRARRKRKEEAEEVEKAAEAADTVMEASAALIVHHYQSLTLMLLRSRLFYCSIEKSFVLITD